MKFKKKKKRKQVENPQLEMTPMIDVVFQLLIFFIVALDPEDILSRLDVSRPAPDPTQKQELEDVKLFEITVYNGGYVLRGTPMTINQLEPSIARMARIDRTTSIIIKCLDDSLHEQLVQLLDICAKYQMRNLAVFSMNQS